MGALETLIGAIPVIGKEANQAKKGRRHGGGNKPSFTSPTQYEQVTPQMEPMVPEVDKTRLDELLEALDTVEPEK